jgi:hypothetical protein
LRISFLDDQDLGVTLDLIGRLHGCELCPPSGRVTGEPTEKDARTVAAAVARDANLAKKLSNVGHKFKQLNGVADGIHQPWRPEDVRLTLSTMEVPGREWDELQFKAWCHFLAGGWLEAAVAAWSREITGSTAFREVYWTLRGRRFQIDVILVRCARLYIVSCTTDKTLALCKSKVFEVAIRARQIGGDLARSALVCLIDGQDDRGKYIDQLRGDVASVWEAPNAPQVFGLADLREWTGVADSPNLGSLSRWLDS